MRVVLDVNVLISALLSPTGAPALTLAAWQDGRFDLIGSPLLLAEMKRALAYPKLRRRITAAEADEVVDWLAREAIMARDPDGKPEVRAADPGDDYLIALAATADGLLVSGDDHLLSLASELPIRSPASFLELLAAQEP